jgi:glycosyltransferase involved in cell wall biosynthesis
VNGAGRLASIIVPAFNSERYLDEALDALERQDHPNIEVIVVDDGSTDGTAEMVRRRPGVRLVQQPNSGPSAARNTGINVAQGEYVTFCDADDRFRPEKVSLQVTHLEENPTVGCVLVHHATFFAEGVSRPEWLTDEEGVQPQSAMVRRSVIEQVGGFDPAYRLTEGLEWLSRMRDVGISIDVLDDVCVDRRIHENNLSYQRAGLQHNMLRSLRARIERNRRHRSEHDNQD